MLIHMARYISDAPVTVVAPTAEVADDLRYLIERLDGCSPDAYTLVTTDALHAGWFRGAVPDPARRRAAEKCRAARGSRVVFPVKTEQPDGAVFPSDRIAPLDFTGYFAV